MSRQSGRSVGIERRRLTNGKVSYRGTAYDPRTRRTRKGPWGGHAEAKTWRADHQVAFRTRKATNRADVRVAAAAEQFIKGVAAGTITSRSGAPYKPSTAVGYERELRNRIIPRFGRLRLDEVALPLVQEWVHELSAAEISGSTVRNIVTAMRALYGWALPLGMAAMNPTRGLRLPQDRPRQPRVVSPGDAASLIQAADPDDRVAIGLAFYGGLRLGELQALRWRHIELDCQCLSVEQSWDHKTLQFVAPKSEAGIRRVMVSSKLAELIETHASRIPSSADQLLLPGPRKPNQPINQNALRDRLKRSWESAGVDHLAVGLHEARHTAASFWIAAGLNFKEVSTFMGHSDIRTTLNIYGHLLPGSQHQAKKKVDAFLAGD